MSMISIRIAQPKDLPEAAHLTSRAMVSNPLVVATFGGRQARWEAATKVAFERLGGQVYLAEDNGQIVGVMRVTESPNCFPSPKTRLRVLPSMVKSLKGSLLPLMKWQQVWERHDPKEHHWHIAALAVLPERQKQGIGTQLMKNLCGYVDSNGGSSYLETDDKDNVFYYEGFGFSVIGEASILDCPNWFMWRPKK